MKPKLLGLFIGLAILFGGISASAAIIDSINAGISPFAGECSSPSVQNPGCYNAYDIGWFYAPTFSYTLNGIGTEFGGTTDSRTVTALIYSGSPPPIPPPLCITPGCPLNISEAIPSFSGSLTLLGSGGLTPVANALAVASIAPIELKAGDSYFVVFENLVGLSPDFIFPENAFATNLGFAFLDDPPSELLFTTVANGPTAQPILAFFGEPVPEPTSLPLFCAGLFSLGVLLYRRSKSDGTLAKRALRGTTPGGVCPLWVEAV